MNKEESLALYEKGMEAWNAWANDILAKKAELEENKQWQINTFRRGGLNNTTRDWVDVSSVNFPEHFFEEHADFSGFIFPYSVNFENATFSRHVKFTNATFGGDAIFLNATFSHFTDFIGATFNDSALFYGAIFNGHALFNIAKFGSVSVSVTQHSKPIQCSQKPYLGAIRVLTEQSSLKMQISMEPYLKIPQSLMIRALKVILPSSP